ncbi:MAG: formate C-acetyltransferase, partial [Clostridiaceae bacterium]
QDKFFISEQDKTIYKESIYPYWEGKSLKDFINKEIDDSIKIPVKKNIFKLNQTDKGQGHIIMDFESILNNGLGNTIKKVELLNNSKENTFYNAALIVLKAASRHILRYKDLACDMASTENNQLRKQELIKIAKISERIAKDKPCDFYEACQLFWYISVIAQLESNASSLSLGRFDQYMLPFYQKSLENGETPEFLRELLECLWVKTNDVVLVRSEDSARYFAGFPTGYTIALGGLTKTGRSAVNKLSYLCLDTYKDILLPQPNLAVRMNELIERPFLNKTVETIKLGTGIPQIFNDEVIVPSFLNRGVSLEDSRDYAIVGCVELSIPGKTYGLHDIALFNLLKVMELSIKELADTPDISFEILLSKIKSNIDKYVDLMVLGSNIVDKGHNEFAPIPFLSCFIGNCLDNGIDVTAGGAKYNFSGVQGIGEANLSDSLYAIKKIVFEEKRITFKDLVEALDSNFEGKENEKLRVRLINKYEKFGNDDEEVDDIVADIHRYYCKSVEKYTNIRNGVFTPGAYTVSAHIPLGAAVGATADGRKSGDQLADGGLSPMVGKDHLGPTAVLKSVSKLDNYLTTNGSLLNVKFSPKSLDSQDGIEKMAGFLTAFTKLKIQHIQFNVISADTLREAQKNPENFKGLVVRVAGYSAFFTELSKEIQNDIISRTEHSL